MSDISSVKRADTAGAVKVIQHLWTGMVTIRADLTDAKTCTEIETATGLTVPAPRRMNGSRDHGLAWMSPDELLVFCPKSTEPVDLALKIDASISGHSMSTDVTYARAVFTLEGVGSREVLAKGAPVDLSVGSFAIGDFRRTRVGQLAAAFWMVAEKPDTFGLICQASVCDFMFDWLSTAAKKGSLPEFL
ncbi:MAG: sarcosine oxidase subunit gamma [Rhodobacteraceae bacterium]|nr:sarcosine oxidase subunit gamma [Paracoccaceae bacterium]